MIAWFGSAGLVAFDHQGNQLWRRRLGKVEHIFGYGASPILHGGLLIVNFGPRELRTQIFENWPSWLTWAIPSPIMMIFMFLMAYQSYEMLKRTRRPSLYVR